MRGNEISHDCLLVAESVRLGRKAKPRTDWLPFATVLTRALAWGPRQNMLTRSTYRWGGNTSISTQREELGGELKPQEHRSLLTLLP